MNEYNALSENFTFLGPTVSRYWAKERELKNWNDSITIARAIRKKYKGADFRIVTGTANSWLGQHSKGLYGNEIMHKVWEEERFHYTQGRVDNFDTRLAELKKEYDDKVAALTKQWEKDLEFLSELKKLEK